jgi:diphthine synthase
MVLFIIGLGLCSEKDISVRGLELVLSSDYVFMEYYTSVLGINKDVLEKYYNKKIELADREMIESDFEEKILEKAKTSRVSLLVVGDPLSATTHMDIYLRCIKSNVQVEVLNNASIMNSCGITGLSLYRFGETVTVPYFTKKWRPTSFYDKILKNVNSDLHTLVLLDIKLKEVSEENLLRGKKIYEPPRFMTINTAIEELLECEQVHGKGIFTAKTMCFGIARIGIIYYLI